MYAALCLSKFSQQAGPCYWFHLVTVEVKLRDFFHGSHWSLSFSYCRRHILKVPIDSPPIHTKLALVETLLEGHLMIIIEELIEIQVLDTLIPQDRIPDDPLRYGKLAGQYLNLRVQAFLNLFLDLQLPIGVDPILIVLHLEFPHQIYLVVLFLVVHLMYLLNIMLMLLFEAAHLSLRLDQLLGKLLMSNDPGLINIIHIVDGIFKDLDLFFVSEFLRFKVGICFGLWV